MNNPVIIFGANGVGKAALEIFESNDVIVYGFLDDNQDLHGTEIKAVSVLGNTDDHGFLKLIGKKCEAFVATDENAVRQDTVTMLLDSRKVMPVNAIHSDVSVPESAHLGHGNFINAGVVVGTSAKISNHCIVNTGALIDYEAVLEDFAQIGAGSIISSGAKIGKGAFIGSGVTVVSGVTIGENARVGAGSVVITDVEEGETVFGNPAKAYES